MKKYQKQDTLSFEFDDNNALINLFGQHDQNLIFIEKIYDVLINHRGNKVKISGSSQSIRDTHNMLKNLYQNPRSVLTPEKVQRWAGIQVVKLFLGMPIVPGK